MSQFSDRVVVAIPNYNMASGLQQLIPRLLSDRYDAIYVLDDASTDNSYDVVQSFPGVHWIKNQHNTGAGGARNLVLHEIDDPATIIHFVDADIELLTTNTADIAKSLFRRYGDNVGMIGGLIVNQHGRQSAWNFGESQSLSATISATWQNFLENLHMHHPKASAWCRTHLWWPWIKTRPNPDIPPVAQPVFWTLEGNFLIRANVLKDAGGFDPTIREHDVQPLAHALQKKGYVSYFDPSITVRHTELSVRTYNRIRAQGVVEWKLAWRFGLLQWLFSSTKHNTPIK